MTFAELTSTCGLDKAQHLLGGWTLCNMLQGDRRKVATITKKKVIQRIARQTGMHPAEVRMVIQGFLDGITEDLTNGDRVEFRDFGVFEVVVRKAKIGRNPKKAKRSQN